MCNDTFRPPTETWLSLYVRGLDLSGTSEGAGGVGGLLARSSGCQTNGSWTSHAFYHADGGRNVTFLSPSTYSGTMTRYSYDAYGRTTSLNGPLATANVYRFSSKELHAASGHYYYGYRFYDPQAQRWINRDPLGEAGGLNLYGFVGNGPVGAVDPDGRDWHVVIMEGGACGVSHRMMIGDDGEGGYYTVEFSPDTTKICSTRRLCGRGVYSYTHVKSGGSAKSYIASLEDTDIRESHVTTSETDVEINHAAKSLDGVHELYCFPFKTCCDIDKSVLEKHWAERSKRRQEPKP